MYSFDTYNATPTSTILSVPENKYFYLNGHFDITVLSGNCYLNGVLLTKDTHHIDQSMYQPAFSFVCKTQCDLQIVPSLTISQELHDLPTKYLSSEMPSRDTELSMKVFPFGGVRIVQNSNVLRMSVPIEWRKMFRKIQQTCSDGPFRVCVIGAKSSGKSTFVNLLVNSLVSHKEVCVMDFDPGQPYCGTVGTFSLAVYERQGFNESYIGNPTKAKRQFILGNSNLGINSELAMMLVRQICEVYFKEYSDLPLIVNTAGWVNGFGLELLGFEIECIQAHLVVDVTPGKDTIRNCKVPLYNKIKSCAEPQKFLPNVLTPKTRRLLSCEAQMISSKWYSIPFKEIALATIDDIQPRFALFAAHYRYVFLSYDQSLETDISKNSTDFPLWYLSTPMHKLYM
ncbi:hypothetical protein EIN_317790 [Entamoeba invadens IP1]|uniref:Clp1 P-loop domain-containing protein n=1 Tax=Entamoeba invadens IP1 TaxID=370355 RepID=A0A0A1TZF7_ENTIV|nr:hypothetical protein EIN_317790 [Entamoeba invadens IP1]ELP86980.1 hypothetical protein EIN_317790 [Entamoeba invadens IP1]|eukprot:XP_004253751.1 hypothetical protein EIN_317790 [Entamoeba invadens IP1]